MTNFTGADLKTWVLVIAGNLLTILIVVRAVGAYARKEWGEMIALLIAAVVVGALVWANDAAISALKALAGLVLK